MAAARVVVLVKAVSEELTLIDDTVDRAEMFLAEPDECATALAVALARDLDAEAVAVTMGPDEAGRAVRRALELGADRAVHVVDDRLRGADVTTTSRVLAATVRVLGGADLVVAGVRSPDSGTGAVAAQVGALLGLPVLGRGVGVAVEGGEVVVDQVEASRRRRLRAALPAVVSVDEAVGEPSPPTFAALVAARRRPVETWSLDGLDEAVEPRPVLASEWTPAARPGIAVVVHDDGTGGHALVDWLRELDVV